MKGTEKSIKIMREMKVKRTGTREHIKGLKKKTPKNPRKLKCPR